MNPDGDPFAEELIAKFLNRLREPISSYPNFRALNDQLPQFSPGTAISLGEPTVVSWKVFLPQYVEIREL